MHQNYKIKLIPAVGRHWFRKYDGFVWELWVSAKDSPDDWWGYESSQGLTYSEVYRTQAEATKVATQAMKRFEQKLADRQAIEDATEELHYG